MIVLYDSINQSIEQSLMHSFVRLKPHRCDFFVRQASSCPIHSRSVQHLFGTRKSRSCSLITHVLKSVQKILLEALIMPCSSMWLIIAQWRCTFGRSTSIVVRHRPPYHATFKFIPPGPLTPIVNFITAFCCTDCCRCRGSEIEKLGKLSLSDFTAAHILRYRQTISPVKHPRLESACILLSWKL